MEGGRQVSFRLQPEFAWRDWEEPKKFPSESPVIQPQSKSDALHYIYICFMPCKCPLHGKPYLKVRQFKLTNSIQGLNPDSLIRNFLSLLRYPRSS